MVEWGWLKFLMELQILLSHSILTWYSFKATTWLSSIDHWITRSTSSLIFFLNCRGKLGAKYLAIYTILHLVGIVLQIQLSLNLLAFGIFSLVSLCVLYYPLNLFIGQSPLIIGNSDLPYHTSGPLLQKHSRYHWCQDQTHCYLSNTPGCRSNRNRKISQQVDITRSCSHTLIN